MASLHLKLLGGFAAFHPSGHAIRISSKKNRALLAYLAVNAAKSLTREKLIGVLWSDRQDSQARSSLRQALVALRQELAGVDPSPIVVDGDNLAIDASRVMVDIREFERLAASDAADDLRRAAELYGGDFLDGIAVRDPAFEDWLSLERSRLRELAMTVLDRLLGHLSGSEAIAAAKRLIAFDPLREASHRALMQLHAAQGHVEQAARQYQVCRDALRRELDVAPSAETAKLYREINEGSYRPAAADLPRPAEPSRGLPEPIEAPLHLPEQPSIAVLPFANMSNDPEPAFFADGLTDDLITDLSQVAGLFVIARNSSFAYKGKSADVRSIARDLGVRYVLEGSARRSEGRVRINVQLIDAVSGGHIWAERFDRALEDVFSVQDEVTAKIVEALVGRLTVQIPDRKRPANMEAYDLTVRGRALLLQSPQGAREARLMFERAIALDPEFAEAHHWLAHSYDVGWGLGGEPKEPNLRLGIEAVQKALALDPNDAGAHAVHAILLSDQRRWDEAEAELAVALKLDPNNADAWAMLSELMTISGRPTEALADIQKALRLNPHPPGWYYWFLGQAQYLDRQYDRAIQSLRREETYRTPSRRILAASLAQLGRLDEARREAAMFMASNQHFTIRNWVESHPYRDVAACRHFVDGYRMAGLPE